VHAVRVRRPDLDAKRQVHGSHPGACAGRSIAPGNVPADTHAGQERRANPPARRTRWLALDAKRAATRARRTGRTVASEGTAAMAPLAGFDAIEISVQRYQARTPHERAKQGRGDVDGLAVAASP
jgi:hypothetical protein